MHKDELVLEFKYFLSILGFALIVYPIRRFIVPTLKFIQQNAYGFAFVGTFYAGLYLYDFNASRLFNDFFNKLLTEDMWAIEWLMSPFLTIGFLEISPALVFLWILLGILCLKVFQLLNQAWVGVRVMFGDLLLLMLWGYYRLAGRTEESVMLISSDEAKNKAALWGIVILIVIIIVGLMAAKLYFYQPYSMNETLFIGNESIPSQPLQLVMP